jgi:hypothetical protein
VERTHVAQAVAYRVPAPSRAAAETAAA